MKTTKLLFSLCLAMLAPHAFATGEAEQASKSNADITAESASETVKTEKKKSRFTIGGIAGTFIATIICAMTVRRIIKTINTDVLTCHMLS